MKLALIGFKSVGKTTIAQAIAHLHGLNYIDTDHLIEKQYVAMHQQTLTTADIFKTHGETYFRNLEKNIISTISNGSPHQILATGGGAVLDPENIFHLKKYHTLVYLETSFELLHQRIKNQTMPSFLSPDNVEQDLKNLYQKRKFLYEEAADIIINVTNKSVSEISKEISQLMTGTIHG